MFFRSTLIRATKNNHQFVTQIFIKISNWKLCVCRGLSPIVGDEQLIRTNQAIHGLLFQRIQ